MADHNVIPFPAPAKGMTPDEARVWRKIFAAEEILRRFPLVMRCRILAAACAMHELPRLAKLVADAAEAHADADRQELQ